MGKIYFSRFAGGTPRVFSVIGSLLIGHAAVISAAAPDSGADAALARKAYERRVASVRTTPGLVAFWDFVQREDGPAGTGKFVAHTAVADKTLYPLEPRNLSLDFWQDGLPATLADFPLLGRGPFGQAVQFSEPKELNQLPVLTIPRSDLHDTPLDIKGPGKSASMMVWLAYQGGDHAIAGIWHEGTDSPPRGVPPVVRERGRRQFALFAGLAANPGGSSVHISENGLASFGDVYARHLAASHDKMTKLKAEATPEELDAGWSVVGFVFDSPKGTVTAYLNGVATELWIDDPAKSRFYAPAAKAWKQAKLAKTPGGQPGLDPAFPIDQFYSPPESVPLKEKVVSESAEERVVIRDYEFTKVRVTLRKDARGEFSEVVSEDLVALKANPYWFGKDIYAPKTPEEGGPFTIGRVIHSNRHSTLAAQIGGVAVFEKALSPGQMQALAEIGRAPQTSDSEPRMLRAADILSAGAGK